MAEKYSELELAPNDPAEQAPEVDLTRETPELDRDKKAWPLPVRESLDRIYGLNIRS